MELEDCILITVDGEKKWCEDNGQFLVSSLKSIVEEDAGTLSYLNPKTGNQRVDGEQKLTGCPKKAVFHPTLSLLQKKWTLQMV